MQKAVADVRSAKLKESMADHWEEYSGTYYDAPQTKVVYEGSDTVVVDDKQGFQYRIFLESCAHTERRFRKLMYELARDAVGRPIDVEHPLVFPKR